MNYRRLLGGRGVFSGVVGVENLVLLLFILLCVGVFFFIFSLLSKMKEFREKMLLLFVFVKF